MSLWEAGKTGWPGRGGPQPVESGFGESQKQHNGEGGVKVNVQHGMSRSGMVMLVLVRHFFGALLLPKLCEGLNLPRCARCVGRTGYRGRRYKTSTYESQSQLSLPGCYSYLWNAIRHENFCPRKGLLFCTKPKPHLAGER